MLSPDSIPWSSEAAQEFETNFDDWIDNMQWLDPESIDWVTLKSLVLFSLLLMSVELLGRHFKVGAK